MDTVLIYTAASIAVIHTVIGIDHYIPFVVMSKTNNWRIPKTIFIVILCGLGHVLSSVILGVFGILLGSQLSLLVGIEEFRGELAKWFLMAFGTVYMIWGIKKAIKNKPHRHTLAGKGEVWHNHDKDAHDIEPIDEHINSRKTSNTFWPLFILFVLGPCEPLIPLLMYPAAESGVMSVVIIALVFSICTITTMLVCTLVALKGISFIPMKKVERYAHALAGFALVVCGITIQVFGL